MIQETFLSSDAARCWVSLSCHLPSDVRGCWYLTRVTPKIGQKEHRMFSGGNKLREMVGWMTCLSWLRPHPRGASCWIWLFLMCAHVQTAFQQTMHHSYHFFSPAASSVAFHCLQALLLIAQDSRVLERQIKRDPRIVSIYFRELWYSHYLSCCRRLDPGHTSIVVCTFLVAAGPALWGLWSWACHRMLCMRICHLRCPHWIQLFSSMITTSWRVEDCPTWGGASACGLSQGVLEIGSHAC